MVACDPSLGPAPELVEARFSDTGGLLYVSFDASTDMGGFPEATACSDVLEFPGAEAATCAWSGTTDSVVATLDYSAVVVPGDAVGLAPALVLKRFCPLAFRDVGLCDCWPTVNASAAALDALGPLTPLMPAAVIQAPEGVSACGGVEVSGRQSTGHGGRSMAFAWTARVEDSVSARNASRLLEEVAAADGDVLAVSGDALVPLAGTTVTFDVALENFLGGATVATGAAEKRGDSSR